MPHARKIQTCLCSRLLSSVLFLRSADDGVDLGIKGRLPKTCACVNASQMPLKQ